MTQQQNANLNADDSNECTYACCMYGEHVVAMLRHMAATRMLKIFDALAADCQADCWWAVSAANRCLSLPAARVKLACVGKSESVSVAAAEVRGFHLEARRALRVLARLQQQQQQQQQ